MTTLLMIAGFIALAGLFAHGAASSLSNPRPTDLEIEQETSDGLYEVLKAVSAGIVLLVAGIGVLSVF
mgnify:CR=1 FL=1